MKANKSLAVGFLYVSITAFYSIERALQWVSMLDFPQWIKIIFGIICFVIWLSGMAFLYYAEKEVFRIKKTDEND